MRYKLRQDSEDGDEEQNGEMYRDGTGRILEVRGRYSGDEDDFQVYDLEHKVSQRPEYG